MSDKVTGSITIGVGQQKRTVTFEGKLDKAQWDDFIESLKQFAGWKNVTVKEVD